MTAAVYKQFWSTFAKLPGFWVGLTAEVIRSLITRVAMVIILSQIVANVSTHNVHAATTNIIVFASIAIAATGIDAIGKLVAFHAENHEYERNVANYFSKLVGKDMSFYKDHQTGYLTGAFRQYLDGIYELTRMIRGELTRSLVAIVAPIVILSLASWKIGLIVSGMILVQFIYIFWSTSLASKARAESHEIYRKLSGEASDNITNIVAFKSSGNDCAAKARIKQLGEAESGVFWSRQKLEASLNLPRAIITNLGGALAYLVIAHGSMSTGSSVALMVLTITCTWNLNALVDTLPELVSRHDDIITKAYPTLVYLGNDYETIKDPARPQTVANPEGAIAIKSIGFSYPNRKGAPTRVFSNLSIDIKASERVGIVGLSGSGKSTLASLLIRFDDVENGSISIDGVDIRDMAQSQLRQLVSFVPQEPLLFHRSIRDNLLYFAPDATEAEMVAAAKAAHAHEFIMKLAHGYDTLVGERGVKLSGGQKQRVVIARAILKNSPIMLFDEATSALDSESEEIIQRALPEIIGRRTAIIIAHRLSTVAGLDRIIVMEKGRIIEQGTHAELLQLQGRYYSLWQKQTKRRAAA